MLQRTPSSTCDSRIPSSLLDVYVRYKQDTRAIVAWLIGHAPRRQTRPEALSIQDLFALARVVRAKAISMPENIAFHFREAIAARRQLSNFFRKYTAGEDGVDRNTLNHEYFTTSLSQIYMDLCECCDQPREACKQRNGSTQPQSDSTATSNQYTTLVTDYLERDGLADNDAQQQQYDKDDHLTGEKPTVSHIGTCSLANDALSEAFELSKDIQEMDDLLNVAKDMWQKVGQGEISLIVAASVTNAVFAAFEGIECRLRTSFDISDPESLRVKFLQVGRCLGLPIESNNESSYSDTHRFFQALDVPWNQLLALKQEGPKKIEEAEIRSRPSSHLILRKSTDSAGCDTQCLTVMLRNIAQLILPGSSSSRCKIVRRSSPVYPEVGYLLTHDEQNGNGVRCAYGLRLLLESYKSCLFVPETNYLPSTCRLHTLRFAQEAISASQAVLDHPTLPCRCHGTLAYHIENLSSDLKTFIHSKMFDFYFQAPWTCGCHALDILDAVSYYGLRLFTYRNHVGSVVHTYNILRRLARLEPVPLLDSLSDAFSDILYPGGRPCRNFKACWVRFMGGRLRFKSHSSDHKSGCYAMVIPAHTAKATAGFGSQQGARDSRFGHGKLSMLHYIREKGYHIDDSICSMLYGSEGSENNHKVPPMTAKLSSGCAHRRHKSRVPPSDHWQRLQGLQKALHHELKGSFPIAKINLFKVYLDCVSIVSKVSDRWHGDHIRPGQHCLCFVDTLLSAADRCKDNEYRLQPLGCKELVGICHDAMTETLGGKDIKQYLWEYV